MSTTKKRIECFLKALPNFWLEVKNHKANRTVGIRPKKIDRI